MAPILKEADTSVATTTASAPANPAAKSPNETPTRPQPVALEIPVTINGARTVDGSDKREPFSETTQTVLVFGHGAVVRVNTPLAPGQLVFLTNEKTKKEVVSQVVKCKAGGSAGSYVELQFTEPSPGFWGLRVPGAPAASAPVPLAVARPVAPATPVAPAPPKSIPPAPPVVAKPIAVVEKPIVPIATAPPPAPPKPSVVPPPPAAKEPEPQPVQVAPPVSAASQSSLAPTSASTLPPPSHTDFPPAPQTHLPTIPPPPPRDYSKEIEALFSTTPHPSHSAPAATPEPKAIPPSSSPSSEELKLQAARLQAQLGSLLFTESPAAHSPATVAPTTPKTEAPLPTSDVAKKILEIAHDEAKPAVKNEPKPVPPVRKSTSAPFSAEDEEVKIPAWLAPLSQNSEPAVSEPAPSSAVSLETLPELPAIDAESSDSLAAEPSARSQAAVFGGQLLGESPVENAQSSSTGSKKGLFFVLAAAAVLIAGGGVWYLRPGLFGSSPIVKAKRASVPASVSQPVTSNPSVPGKVLTPAPPAVNPAPVASTPAPLQPSRNPEPVSSPATSAAHQPKKTNPAPEDATETEPPKESPLGEVHLAAPVLTRTGDAQQAAAPLPSVDTNASNPGADAFAGVATAHRKQPVAPLPIGGEVTPAQLIKSVPPIYPSLAKTQRIAGNVQIDALVDTSGNVADVKVISGPPLLHHAALDAVKQWKYKPATLDGQPTSMHLTVTVEFRTQQ